MAAVADLSTLLASMKPALRPETFVFCTLPQADWSFVGDLAPVVTVKEAEGLTLVVNAATASAYGLSASRPMRMITLTVHSDLEAVGLTATFAGVLTKAGVSANAVAGYHHDHIFVPARQAEDAMAALIHLQEAAANGMTA